MIVLCSAFSTDLLCRMHVKAKLYKRYYDLPKRANDSLLLSVVYVSIFEQLFVELDI